MGQPVRPLGTLRNAIVAFMKDRPEGATVQEVYHAVTALLGDVAPSSVRSSLQTWRFERIEKGRYKLRDSARISSR